MELNDFEMTPRDYVLAAFDGTPSDRYPVAAPYWHLYVRDHFAELTGRPHWQLEQWLCSEPEEHVALLREMHALAPFDIVECVSVSQSREWRERQEFLERDDGWYRHDRKTGESYRIDRLNSGHAMACHPNQRRWVENQQDIDRTIRIHRADEAIRNGANDYLDATVRAFGRDHFIMSGGVVGTVWSAHEYLGLTNLLVALVEEPDLVEHLCRRILEQRIEDIRRLCAGGGDAVFIDESIATADMISLPHYERFALPYITEMVHEIQRHGHRAILIYYGAVADRLDHIASTGADGLIVETSMKGYVNDIEEIVSHVGSRMTVFSNIDPVGVLQEGTDDELDREFIRQIDAGRNARGFVLAPASPITPRTPLARVQRFIERAQAMGTRTMENGP